MNASQTEEKKNDFVIPIWGPTTSGKTTYLVALYIEMKNDNEWEMWPADARAFQFLDTRVDNLERGRFFDANPGHVPSEDPYCFNLRRRGGMFRKERKARLAFWDAPGDLYEDPLGTEETFSGDPKFRIFFNSMHISAGVICLMDLKAGSEESRISYARFVRRTIFALQRDVEGNVLRQVQRPIAWVLTKVDKPERWPYRYDPEQYAINILGETLMEEIKRTCARYKWFAVSSVGVITDPSTGEMIPNYELAPENSEYLAKIKDPAHREPFGITEPIVWVLEQLPWQ